MRSWVNPGWVLAASSLLGAATCSKNQSEPVRAGSPADAPAKGASNAPPPMARGDGLTAKDLVTVDLGGLSPSQTELFLAVANDENCPCDCPMTFAACLADAHRCPAARVMASVILRDIHDGIPPDMLRAEMAEAFSGGYSAPPRKIALDGYGSLGPATAPLTVVEFSDFECPHCRDAAPVIKALIKKFPGEVRVVFKHFPLNLHVMARDAAVATEAANRQGKFWEMHDKVFENQDHLSQDTLKDLARQIGLDLKQYEKDVTDPVLAARVEASRKEGEVLGINSTPTVFVNGRRFGLRRTLENFEARFEMERLRGQQKCN